MKFPTISEVSAVLRHVNASVDEECDVRLQMYEDGSWAVRFGLSDYDQDHRGYWGASSVPGKRFNARDVARDLISQVKDDYYSANA